MAVVRVVVRPVGILVVILAALVPVPVVAVPLTARVPELFALVVPVLLDCAVDVFDWVELLLPAPVLVIGSSTEHCAV